MRDTVKRSNRLTGKFAAIVAVAVALVVAALTVVFIRSDRAYAETEGTVTIHIYDPSNTYDTLGIWAWVDGGSGTLFKDPTTLGDEQFKRDEDGNTARALDVKFDATNVAALKGGKRMGLLLVSPNFTGAHVNSTYNKETEDVFVDLTNAFDANNHANVYYVRKDKIAFTVLEDAMASLEKITGAYFSQVSASSMTVVFETTTPLTPNTEVVLYQGETELKKVTSVTVDAENRCKGTVRFTGVSFNISNDYTIKVGRIPDKSSIAKTVLLDTADFIKAFECADTQKQELGAIYTKASTTFRVWAPLATAVKLRLYDDGMPTELDNSTDAPLAEYEMTKRVPTGGDWGGIWEYKLDGDQNGKYYTYVLTNNGKDTETIDPYAKACGANGARGMVIDLKSTDPSGWEEDKSWYKKNDANKIAVDTPIIWEVSVNDFSSSADSGMKYKGKYLAFTESGTTVPGTSLKTGVDYLRDLGITYVHLNPVYDFATVDEADMTKADSSTFNWGYDPQNYNIPEGSYSTDPYNGAVRINEFKRMVKALHDAGIGVVMDVVYNHTFKTANQALHDTVPGYYHRTGTDGEFTNASGCGNETASERTMVRKYIVESMLYWATEYHIDGFRFDLMGIHDAKTINKVREKLDRLTDGTRILMYGEPWSADGTYTPASYTARVTATTSTNIGEYDNNSSNKLIKHAFSEAIDKQDAFNVLSPRVAIFNGSGRDGLRGEGDASKLTQGWVNGNPGELGRVRKMIEGGVGDFGSGVWTGLGSRNVAYAAAHDNYLLWDQVLGAPHGNETGLFYDYPNPEAIARCKLVAGAYMMSAGMCFMPAGEEMGRTKYGNENSYKSPVKLNRIEWSRQATFKDLHDFYKSVIALRKKHSSTLFSYTKTTTKDFSFGNFTTTDYDTGKLVFTRKTLTLTLDPSTLTGSIVIGSDRINIRK